MNATVSTPVKSIQTLPAPEVHRRIASGEGVRLIDVRTPMEFKQVHAQGATPVPLDQLTPGDFRTPDGGCIALICKSGARAAKAADRLSSAGCTNVVIVEGGTDAWVAAGLPAVRGQAGVSLERQVRIAAGSLVVLGAILSWAVHPAFLALSVFVGAGLVFSGVTNTCGMGLILARAPWNR